MPSLRHATASWWLCHPPAPPNPPAPPLPPPHPAPHRTAQGSPYAVTSILDTMRAISAPVATVAFGIVGGTATAVLAAGAKGRRFSMENTRILLQQPMGGLQGSAGASCVGVGEWGLAGQASNLTTMAWPVRGVRVIDSLPLLAAPATPRLTCMPPSCCPLPPYTHTCRRVQHHRH